MSGQVRLSDCIAPVYRDMHRALRHDQYDEYMISGGRGSAKSTVTALEMVMGLLRDPNANAMCIRRVGNTIKDSVYTQIQIAIDMLLLTNYFDTRVSPHEYIYRPTGQRIMFRGADKPERLKSIKPPKGYFKYLWFEETSEYDGMDDVRSIKASILRGSGSARCVAFYTYNPPRSAKCWVNNERMKMRNGRMNLHTTYKDLPSHWLGDSFLAEIEAVRATNDRAYRNTYLGEITGTEGKVFDNVEIKRITDDEIRRFDRMYDGLDFGYAVDPYAFVRWHYDRRERKLYALQEIYAVRLSMDTLAEKIRTIVGRNVVICDSADPRSRDDLIKLKVNAVSAMKGPNSRERGMRWLQDLGAIVIDEQRTPNIAREFQSYEYERTKGGMYIARYPDGDDHTIDATRYSMEREINVITAKAYNGRMLGI